MPIDPVNQLIFIVATATSETILAGIYNVPVLLVPFASSAAVSHPVHAVPVLLISVATSVNATGLIVLVPALALLVPAITSPFAMGGLFNLVIPTPVVSILTSANTAGLLHGVPTHLAPPADTTTATGPIPMGLAVVAAPVLPPTTSDLAGDVFSNVSILVVTIVNSAVASDYLHGVYAVAHVHSSVPVRILIPSVRFSHGQHVGAHASGGPLSAVVHVIHHIDHVDATPNDRAMRVDDPDHPMGDDTTHRTLDSTEDNMDVDVDV